MLALLGFPWFAIIGFYDRANSSLIWATLVSLTLLAYAFYYDQSLVDDFLIKSNKILIDNNYFNTSFVANLEINKAYNKFKS